MGQGWVIGMLTGALIFQIAAGAVAPAYGKLEERLTVQDGQFVRANGTAIEGAVAKGITVSKYQNRAGEIDWERVAADNVTFAMVRLGYHEDLDPYFDENMQGAISQGIRTGVFLYTQAMDVETAREEARFVLEKIKDYPVSYPVAYDVESQYLLDMGKTPQELAGQVNAFCEVIAEAGYCPVVYGNHKWLTSYIDTSQIPYDIWYARYETSVNEFPNRTIWQYTDAGQVDGIQGEVCIEIAFADYRTRFPGTGWRQMNGNRYYYQDYVKQTGWLFLEDGSYFLREDGSMVSGGEYEVDGILYQFDENGRRVNH